MAEMKTSASPDCDSGDRHCSLSLRMADERMAIG